MTTPKQALENRIAKKSDENVIEHHSTADRSKWFYCRKYGHLIPLCKMASCPYYPCNTPKAANEQ